MTVVVVPRPAAADEISSLKAEAAQIAQQLIAEQLQVGGYEEQYALAAQRLRHDAEAVTETEQQVAHDDRRIEQDRTRLRERALSDYMSSSADSLAGVQELFESNDKTAALKTEYEKLARGAVSNGIDQLRIDEDTLRSQQATLEHQEAQDQATTSQEAAFAERARNTQAQLQLLHARVNGELAGAVAQQQAAQAAAAAAAVRAAQAKAKRAFVPSAPGAGQVVTDPTLPAFLQCARQAESNGNYGAVSPGGTYMGAFQFSQATWNEAAVLAGLPALAGVPPNRASPTEQDALAVALYAADGKQPWYDPCRSG